MLKISLAFITQSYFFVPKYNRINSTHLFVMEILNRKELSFSHLSYIDFQGFLNLYKRCTAKSYFLFVIDTTLASDNSLCFRKNLSERI